MRNELKAVLAVVLMSLGCGLPEETGPAEAAVSAPDAGSAFPVYARAFWTDETTCVGGVLGGHWATYAGVSPPALLGTISPTCCPAPGTYVATCDCPLHGPLAACSVIVKADCSATLVGHSEWNMWVILRF